MINILKGQNEHKTTLTFHHIRFLKISSDASKLLLINNTLKINTNKHFSWDPLYKKHKNTKITIIQIQTE